MGLVSSNLQIILLSRDRPDYLREALRSVLSQSGDNIEVVVSDNSEREDVSLMLATEFSSVTCIRRKPTLDAFEHFRTIISSATADLLVMFHDDDVMMEGYVHTLRSHLDADPTLAAVCCNATILRGNRPTNECFCPDRRGDLKLSRPEDMLQEYFSLSDKGPAPFPGYMYRRAAIQGLFLNPLNGGKYSDVSFLLDVLRNGPVLWLDDVRMQYRIHDCNDSATEVIGQRLRLLRYVYKSTSLHRHSPIIAQYRFRYWSSWWRTKLRHQQTWRTRVVKRFLITNTLKYALTRSALWRRVFTKLRRIVHHSLEKIKRNSSRIINRLGQFLSQHFESS